MQGELVSQFWEHAKSRFESGEFKPIIDKTFTLDEAQAAHDYMETNASNGKILLKVVA